METVAPIEDLAQVATRWQDTMLSLEKEYEQASEVLKISEVAIGTLGNFSASIGKAKSKKTFNVSAMVAAALSGKEILNYTTDFPDGKNLCQIVDLRFLYFINSTTSSGNIAFPASSFGAFLRNSIGTMVYFLANGSRLALRRSAAVSCLQFS